MAPNGQRYDARSAVEKYLDALQRSNVSYEHLNFNRAAILSFFDFLDSRRDLSLGEHAVPDRVARHDFFEAVIKELERAYQKHGAPHWTKHEFFAVLLEEFDELWDAIKGDEPLANVARETVQVAAMCFRYFETTPALRKAAHPVVPSA